jgi:CheY-like chemotaxis protein
MGAKRALIVDDSKSARLFLARALEKYDIDVDSAETAEAAIEYLGTVRPDVIFMDHQMPGMDGLQAVQHIKNDPRTATIPIMMYTSQEGELYLGQARALGAIGVLPKQIKPTDVSKVLYQLHLVPDRRNREQTTFTALNVRVEEAATQGMPPGAKALTDITLREHFAELRRALVAGVDTQTDRITGEVRALLLEMLPSQSGLAERPRAPWAWIVASVALAVALISSALWWRSVRLLEDLSVQVTELRARESPLAAVLPAPAPVAHVPAAATADTAPAAAAPAADVRPLVIPVPYGADTFGGARYDLIRQFLFRLVHQKVTGVAEVRTFAGRFCLVGSAGEGYSLAPEDAAFSKCDLVGNPSEDGSSATQRTPLALANLIGEIRSSTHGALDVQLASGDPASVVTAYPTPTTDLTAGEWNRAASSNNRVEIRVR